MAVRIEVFSKSIDARAQVKLKKFKSGGFNVDKVEVLDVYTIDKKFSKNKLKKIAESLSNPISQGYQIRTEQGKEKNFLNNFNWAIETGFLPGVTDNIGHSAKEIIEDLLKIKFNLEETVYSSTRLLLSGSITEKETESLAKGLINPLIQRVHIKNKNLFLKDNGMDFIVPKVVLEKEGEVIEVDLDVSDEELAAIGKAGIKGKDGKRKGPLALNLFYMKEIQKYFRKLRRKPTDIELETLAQTWSEHCKHTFFADPLDEIKNGLFKTYIKKATEKIGKKDFCVSVFTDNSGAIAFNEDYLLTHKAETHNSPSALDPFGGAITGVVGVNRDTLGFGLGAKPIANIYGYMFGDPDDKRELFRDAKREDKMLSPRRIMDGVIEGINAGGNQSGIPSPQGFLYFDDRYRGKPLVFCGTVGLIPRKTRGRLSHIKKAKAGDYIVMVGGRVGLDGIHGATFSSEGLDTGSPATAVQIGDPITQKKLSDVLVREVRDMGLYNSITDNGAGGLSSSIGEMAKESGGCKVYLEKVPLKYPGLDPWQIWISESQERMTLSVPKNKWERLKKLLESRGVGATIIGEFTNSKFCQVFYNKKKIMDIDLEFLHDGLPPIIRTSKYTKPKNSEPKIPSKVDYNQALLNLLSRKSIASFEFISSQYDHDVQGGSVLKPLIGKGRVNSESSVIRPLPKLKKGFALSQGYFPSYSDIDTYNMAAASIDAAVRNLIAVGANPEKIAILDNFCWSSSNDPQRLGELKRALKACFDTAVFYKTPFISGKDSMFNDFQGFDSRGEKIKISVPPTLLISSMGIVEDIEKVVSIDLKMSGDLLYVLGETTDELGGSEYFRVLSGDDPQKTGNKVPGINLKKNLTLYKKLSRSIDKNIISSSIALTRGGLGVGLAKMSMAGNLGVKVFLDKLPGKQSRDDFALFSESLGRFLVTINPKNKVLFEKIMEGSPFAKIGTVGDDERFSVINSKDKEIINLSVSKLLHIYKSTFKGY